MGMSLFVVGGYKPDPTPCKLCLPTPLLNVAYGKRKLTWEGVVVANSA